MGYSEYTRNRWRLAAGVALRKWLTEWDSVLISITNLQNFLGSKFDKYERMPTDYDYALFAFLFSGTVAEHYDKNKHNNLFIKRCKHLNHHIHNTIAITPENIIFAIKLIKLFREKSIDTYLTAEIVKYKIKDFHGEVFDNETKVSGYIHQHVKTLNHLLVWAVFMALSQVYDVTTSKKLTLEYLGFENIIKVNEHINMMEKDFIFDLSIQQTYIKREVDTKIENIEGFRKIVYRNFAEWAMKWMDLLWSEWQLEQNEEKVERDDQVAIAFFKKSIDETISKYDMNKEDVDHFNFISNFYQKYGNEERESKSVNEVINTLKSLTVDDTNVVDNDDMKVDTQVYSLFGSKAKSKGRVKYDNDEVDETIEYFDRALNLDNNLSQLRKVKRVNPWINKNYVWSEFAFYIDHILCFTLIFYHQIYNNIEEADAEYLKEYSFSNTKAKKFNSELIELCSKVDSLCKSDKDENHYKVFICSFNEQLITEWFDHNYSFNTIFEWMSEEHPYFNFNVEMDHIWTKIRKKPAPFSPKKLKKLHLMKGYMEWRMEETENSTIVFTDGFMDGDFIDSELSGNFSCCGSKKFKASIDEYPRFMWIKLNMNYLSKRIRRVFRFSPFVSPSAGSIERLELLAIMFMSSRSYFSIIKMRSSESEDEGAQRIKWCVYNSLVSEELYEVPENNIEDSVLVVKDSDFEKDTYPCLLLYAKCT